MSTQNVTMPHGEGKPLVSVIMPMYNAAKVLSESIESVINQTYTSWELIVIDDSSNDDSMSIAQSYASRDGRIRVLSNPHHNGMPSAPRNFGIAAAKGRYIAFLDSDDLWHPDKLRQQLPLFDAHPSAAIVFSDYEKMSEDGTRNNRVVRAPGCITYDQLLHCNFIGNLTGIYDTHKVGKVHVRDVHHEDYVMWLEILKQGYTAVNTGTVLAYYRLMSQSVSSRRLEVVMWPWRIYRQVLCFPWLKAVRYYLRYSWYVVRKNMI